jgi:hypothetical protein
MGTKNGAKGEEVAGGKRILHNQELHNLHDLINILSVMKSRRVR